MKQVIHVSFHLFISGVSKYWENIHKSTIKGERAIKLYTEHITISFNLI